MQSKNNYYLFSLNFRLERRNMTKKFIMSSALVAIPYDLNTDIIYLS